MLRGDIRVSAKRPANFNGADEHWKAPIDKCGFPNANHGYVYRPAVALIAPVQPRN